MPWLPVCSTNSIVEYLVAQVGSVVRLAMNFWSNALLMNPGALVGEPGRHHADGVLALPPR